jgi:hypothetical protein
MTAERRLVKVETSLSPTQLVLRWLDEAHAFGDLESYTRSLFAGPVLDGPLDRLARQAERVARMSGIGMRPEVVNKTVRTALRETFFRFELVMRINVVAHDLLDREVLIDAALAANLGVLSSASPKAREADITYLARFAERRDLLELRVRELRAEQEARTLVEERYLAGHTALFPDAVTAWDAQCLRTETLADVAVRLAELDGVPPAQPVESGDTSGRAIELVADLVEPAKATALHELGESRQAIAIGAAWLGARLEPVRPKSDLTAQPELAARQ